VNAIAPRDRPVILAEDVIRRFARLPLKTRPREAVTVKLIVRPEFVSPPTLYPGAPYEYAAIAPAGSQLVFVAGACPLNDAGEVLAPGDYERQAHAALENLRVALEAAGSGFDRVLKTTVYVASDDRAQLVRVWAVVEQAFTPARPPSTLLGVAALGYSGQLVEIEAVGLASEPEQATP
jgi:enamine deaminase RidA (YjgF/YER057c/UK114 family)